MDQATVCDALISNYQPGTVSEASYQMLHWPRSLSRSLFRCLNIVMSCQSRLVFRTLIPHLTHPHKTRDIVENIEENWIPALGTWYWLRQVNTDYVFCKLSYIIAWVPTYNIYVFWKLKVFMHHLFVLNFPSAKCCFGCIAVSPQMGDRGHQLTLRRLSLCLSLGAYLCTNTNIWRPAAL